MTEVAFRLIRSRRKSHGNQILEAFRPEVSDIPQPSKMADGSATPPPSCRSVSTPPAHYGTVEFRGIRLRCMVGFAGNQRDIVVGAESSVAMIGHLLGIDSPISVLYQGVVYKGGEKPFENLGFLEEETVQVVVSPQAPELLAMDALLDRFLVGFPPRAP